MGNHFENLVAMVQKANYLHAGAQRVLAEKYQVRDSDERINFQKGVLAAREAFRLDGGLKGAAKTDFAEAEDDAKKNLDARFTPADDARRLTDEQVWLHGWQVNFGADDEKATDMADACLKAFKERFRRDGSRQV